MSDTFFKTSGSSPGSPFDHADPRISRELAQHPTTRMCATQQFIRALESSPVPSHHSIDLLRRSLRRSDGAA